MLIERFFPVPGHEIPGIGLSVDEGFLHPDKSLSLQCFKMGCEIAIGHIQIFFQSDKVEHIVYRQNRHDSKSDAALEGFVQIIEWYFHSTSPFVSEINVYTIDNMNHSETGNPKDQTVINKPRG